jgi:two-component system response regulator AtoC
VLERFATYAWPGNIRELKNVIERAVVVSGGGTLRLVHLPPAVAQGAHGSTDKVPSAGPTSAAGLLSDLESIERQRIVRALEECQGNQTKAAKLLGISRRMLVGRLDVHGLPRPRKKD